MVVALESVDSIQKAQMLGLNSIFGAIGLVVLQYLLCRSEKPGGELYSVELRI